VHLQRFFRTYLVFIQETHLLGDISITIVLSDNASDHIKYECVEILLIFLHQSVFSFRVSPDLIKISSFAAP
jgi:hypothetical protein